MSTTNFINTDNPKAYGYKTQSLHTPVAALKGKEEAAKTASSGTKAAEMDSKSEGFSFWDLVDIVNPLQHIPVVSSVYRELTGDKINNFGRVAGGALFGGFVGAIVGGVNAVAVNETGSDVGQMAMNKVGFTSAAAPVEKPVAATPAVKENIPVIEVRPMAKKSVQEPIEVASAMPSAKDLNTLEPGSAGDKPEAMPDAVALNAMEPGNANSPMPQVVETAQVPQAMMQALAKYEAMQKLGAQDKANIVPEKLKANAETAEATGQIIPVRKFANLGKDVRRY